MGMKNEQKSIVKKKYVHSYICGCHILDLFQAKLKKKHRKIFHNYFCYSKKDKKEDLLSKEQLSEKNEKKKGFWCVL